MFSQKPNILFVDDEENNLFSLKSAFRKVFNVYTAISVEEAWEKINEEEIHVIVSDQRMPGTTGVDFFENLYFVKPDIVRILLTGYEDLKPVVEAINKGRIYRFVSKPWEENDLKVTIDNAYEKYKTQRLLKIKNQELQKAYNELDHLVYSASHDIRGPLTSILGITRLCRIENEEGTLNQYYDYIDESVAKLEMILKSIVDYSRNSRMESLPEVINFNELLEEVLEEISNSEDYFDSVKIETSISDNIQYIGDKGRVYLILENLIRNSIRFADNSELKKAFVKIDIVTSNKTVRIKVEDNGIGIHPSEEKRIFHMFYRGNNMSKGSGMGLYIVKEAIDKLEGEIELDSSFGVGSMFKVVLKNMAI